MNHHFFDFFSSMTKSVSTPAKWFLLRSIIEFGEQYCTYSLDDFETKWNLKRYLVIKYKKELMEQFDVSCSEGYLVECTLPNKNGAGAKGRTRKGFALSHAFLKMINSEAQRIAHEQSRASNPAINNFEGRLIQLIRNNDKSPTQIMMLIYLLYELNECRGFFIGSKKQLAEKLNVSVPTLQKHLPLAYELLGIKSYFVESNEHQPGLLLVVDNKSEQKFIDLFLLGRMTSIKLKGFHYLASVAKGVLSHTAKPSSNIELIKSNIAKLEKEEPTTESGNGLLGMENKLRKLESHKNIYLRDFEMVQSAFFNADIFNEIKTKYQAIEETKSKGEKEKSNKHLPCKVLEELIMFFAELDAKQHKNSAVKILHLDFVFMYLICSVLHESPITEKPMPKCLSNANSYGELYRKSFNWLFFERRQPIATIYYGVLQNHLFNNVILEASRFHEGLQRAVYNILKIQRNDDGWFVGKIGLIINEFINHLISEPNIIQALDCLAENINPSSKELVEKKKEATTLINEQISSKLYEWVFNRLTPIEIMQIAILPRAIPQPPPKKIKK